MVRAAKMSWEIKCIFANYGTFWLGWDSGVMGNGVCWALLFMDVYKTSFHL